MAVQTLGQQRSRHAWEAVQDVKGRLGGDFEKNFADRAKKMPARIRTSGLGQTVAYMRAKREGLEVLQAVASWCHKQGLVKSADSTALLMQFNSGSAAELRMLTGEVMAYLEWLVRFADAESEKKQKEKK